MSPSVPTNRFYGARGRLKSVDAGVRRVAPTFGKALFLSYSTKCRGHMVVESDAERLVAHILTLDPGVREFSTQPFTVDLIDRRILKTSQSVAEARARHRGRAGPKFYTPDFLVQWHMGGRTAIEVKFEGYEGDAEYEQKLLMCREVIIASGLQFLRVVLPSAPRHPIRSNVPLLTKAAQRHDLWPTPELVQSVEAALEAGAAPLGALCKEVALSPSLAPVLLVTGVVSADVGQHPINGDMLVTPAYGDLGHLALLQGVAK
ncbi:MAG: hypothetical protein AB7E59_10275 [Pusillimonas sp.]